MPVSGTFADLSRHFMGRIFVSTGAVLLIKTKVDKTECIEIYIIVNNSSESTIMVLNLSDKCYDREEYISSLASTERRWAVGIFKKDLWK